MIEDTNTAIFREILKWVRIQGISQAKAVLNDALKTDRDKIVFEYSDGERSSAEIGKLVGISQSTVQRYWAKWATLGVVDPVAVKGGTRYKKTFSLETFGIEIPETPINIDTENDVNAERIIPEAQQSKTL